MRQPVSDTNVTVVESRSSTTSTGTSEGVMDGDPCQDCIVTAGMPNAAASSLHAAPQARRPDAQLVSKASRYPVLTA